MIESMQAEHPPAPRQRFIGTWKLVASRATVTGVPEEPYGSDPTGYITYTDDGYMHAILLAPGTDPSVQPVAYAGTWEVRAPAIIHHVMASVIPEWIGTDQVRAYQFHADHLTLTMSFPDDQYVALVWQKAESRLPREETPDPVHRRVSGSAQSHIEA